MTPKLTATNALLPISYPICPLMLKLLGWLVSYGKLTHDCLTTGLHTSVTFVIFTSSVWYQHLNAAVPTRPRSGAELEHVVWAVMQDQQPHVWRSVASSSAALSAHAQAQPQKS